MYLGRRKGVINAFLGAEVEEDDELYEYNETDLERGKANAFAIQRGWGRSQGLGRGRSRGSTGRVGTTIGSRNNSKDLRPIPQKDLDQWQPWCRKYKRFFHCRTADHAAKDWRSKNLSSNDSRESSDKTEELSSQCSDSSATSLFQPQYSVGRTSNMETNGKAIGPQRT